MKNLKKPKEIAEDLDTQVDDLSIPTLLFHKVTPKWEVGISCVKPNVFRKMMTMLKEQGWQTILPSHLLNDYSKQKIREKSFILTFDDGYDCLYEYVLPILNELDFQAIVFIPTKFIGKRNDWDHHLLGREFHHLKSSQIKSLIEHGWEVGSHTVSHRSSLEIDDVTLREEFLNSRLELENLLGIRINWISFPFGRWDPNVLQIAIGSGYSGAITIFNKFSRTLSLDFTIYKDENVSNRLNFDYDLLDGVKSFKLIFATAIYQFDNPKSVIKLMDNPQSPQLLRRWINWCSIGTIVWNKLFTKR